MSGFWGGVLASVIVLIAVPALLAIAGLLVAFAFEHVHLVKPLPLVPKTQVKRANLAAATFCAERVARVFWIAGFGIVVYRQNRKVITYRHNAICRAIIETDREVTEK